jgi:hypothetical protein
MARKPAKPFEYLFKLAADPETAKPMLKISKMEDGNVVSEYSLRGALRTGARCDCPATMRAGAAACKHVGWGRRYMAIADRPDVKAALAEGAYVYYTNESDTFILNREFSGQDVLPLVEG